MSECPSSMVIWDTNVYNHVLDKCGSDLPQLGALRARLDSHGLRPWLTPVNLLELAATKDEARRSKLLLTAFELVEPQLLRPPEYLIRTAMAGWTPDFDPFFSDDRVEEYRRCARRGDFDAILQSLPELKSVGMVRAAERLFHTLVRTGIVVPDDLYGLSPPDFADEAEDYFLELERRVKGDAASSRLPRATGRITEALFHQLAGELTFFPGDLRQMWDALGLPTLEARIDYLTTRFRDVRDNVVVAQLWGMMAHQHSRSYNRGDHGDRLLGTYLVLGARWVTAEVDVLAYAQTVSRLRRVRQVVRIDEVARLVSR